MFFPRSPCRFLLENSGAQSFSEPYIPFISRRSYALPIPYSCKSKSLKGEIYRELCESKFAILAWFCILLASAGNEPIQLIVTAVLN